MSCPRWALLAVLLLASAAALAQAQRDAIPTAADWAEIKRVVAAQREALVAGDGERAFSFASPAIGRQYGTVDAFMRMIASAYRALVDARYVEFLDGAVIAGDVVQPLRLVLPDGEVKVALYGMERQADGGWRISACVIAPSTVRAA